MRSELGHGTSHPGRERILRGDRPADSDTASADGDSQSDNYAGPTDFHADTELDTYSHGDTDVDFDTDASNLDTDVDSDVDTGASNLDTDVDTDVDTGASNLDTDVDTNTDPSDGHADTDRHPDAELHADGYGHPYSYRRSADLDTHGDFDAVNAPR